MRRWRNLPFRRGVFWRPASPAPQPPQPPRRAARRLARVSRGQFLPVPPAPVTVPAPAWVAPLLRQPRRLVPPRRRTPPAAVPAAAPPAPAAPQQGHDVLRLLRPPRGQFLPVPVPAAAVAAPPSWAAPPLRQPRRWLPPRRRGPAAVTAVTAVTVPAGMPRRLPRLGRPPRGQFLSVPPAAPAVTAPGPFVPPHLRQRRTQPLRVPRGHRADPPWQGTAAPPVLPAVPQFPRQGAARARQPRRGCLLGVPPGPAAVPVPMRRRAQPGIAPSRRGCVFRVPAAPAGNVSPGPLVIPFVRAAGHRPRWPARPRRGCFLYLAPVIVHPPPFTVGTLTASAASSVLTAAQSSSALTAATAAQGTLTAAAQATGGPGG